MSLHERFRIISFVLTTKRAASIVSLNKASNHYLYTIDYLGYILELRIDCKTKGRENRPREREEKIRVVVRPSSLSPLLQPKVSFSLSFSSVTIPYSLSPSLYFLHVFLLRITHLSLSFLVLYLFPFSEPSLSHSLYFLSFPSLNRSSSSLPLYNFILQK